MDIVKVYNALSDLEVVLYHAAKKVKKTWAIDPDKDGMLVRFRGYREEDKKSSLRSAISDYKKAAEATFIVVVETPTAQKEISYRRELRKSALTTQNINRFLTRAISYADALVQRQIASEPMYAEKIEANKPKTKKKPLIVDEAFKIYLAEAKKQRHKLNFF